MNLGALQLKQEFNRRQERNPEFSLRAFARWLKVSPGQLSQILSGKRPLSPKMALALSNRLGHSPREKLDFLSNASATLSAEQSRKRQSERFLDLEDDRFRAIADWHHLAILSLTRVKGAKSEPRWIARRLGMSSSEANESLSRLVRLGLLSLKPKFEQLSDPIRIAPRAGSQAVRPYHHQNLSLAIEKLEAVPKELRDFQSITLAINPKRIERLRGRIDEFLTEASDILDDGDLQEVYTLAFQLFPVSRSPKKSAFL